jgi:hypothetical protein
MNLQTAIRNNRKCLSTIGLDDEMILGMSDADIAEYCTRDNFIAMFGECDLTDAELATFTMAIRGQRFLLKDAK